MSLEDFQLVDNEPFDKNIIKRYFLKVYHQQRAQLNQSHQNIHFVFGENNNYHHIGNVFLEFDFTVRKSDSTNFHNEDRIRLGNNGFAFCCKEARLSTKIVSVNEIKKFCRRVSTIMKVISNKIGDLLSQFDNINEIYIAILSRINALPPQFSSTPHQKLLIDNHIDANKD